MATSVTGVGAVGGVQSLFGPVSSGSGMGDDDGGFSGLMKSALQQVSAQQGDAQTQVNNVMAGGNADMGKVMVAVEKADVSFQLMMQVRNKVVSAYQDIEKMQF